MHRFLVPSAVLEQETASFDRSAARHLQTVLRVKPGEELEFFDGVGRTRLFKAVAVRREGMEFQSMGEVRLHPAPKCRLTLYVSLIKRLEWAIEKATELGSSVICPVATARSVVKIAPADASSKAERWLKISEEALRQCGGAWMPEVRAPIGFVEAMQKIAALDSEPVFVGALSGATGSLLDAVSEISDLKAASLFIGPEGDFAPEELEALLKCEKVRPVTFGSRVLRAETACIYGLSLLGAKYL